MGDVANTFSSLKPLLKEAYSGPMKTHSRPGKEHSFSSGKFQNLKKKLKKD